MTPRTPGRDPGRTPAPGAARRRPGRSGAAARTAPGPVPYRGVTTALALGLPLVTTAAALALAHAWRPELPELIVTGWGPDGPRDAATFAATVWPLAALTVVLAVGMWAVGFYWGQSAMNRRFAVGFAVGTGIFVPGLLLTMLHGQRGLAPGQEPALAGAAVAAVIAAAVLLGAVVARLTPGDPPRPTTTPVPDAAARLPLAASEQAVWVRTVGQQGAPYLVALSVTIALIMGFATREWWLSVMVGVSLALAATLLGHWTVTVSAAGLVARGVLPRPRLTVPIDEVESAEVGRVRPLRDFGGWGLRVTTGGRTGLVLRSGEAIVIHRTGGRVIVVTVDDAATAVALLNSLAARTR